MKLTFRGLEIDASFAAKYEFLRVFWYMALTDCQADGHWDWCYVGPRGDLTFRIPLFSAE